MTVQDGDKPTSQTRRLLGRRSLLAVSTLGLTGCLQYSLPTDDSESEATPDDEEENGNNSEENDSDPTALELPPGVLEDKVQSGVLEHHDRELSSTSFESLLISNRSSGDSMIEETHSFRYDNGVFVGERTRRDTTATAYVENETSLVLQRGETADSTLYSDGPPVGDLLSPRFRNRLHGHLAAATYRPVEWVDLDGEEVLRATASDPDDLDRLPIIRSAEDVNEYEGEVLIDSAGVIRRLEVVVEKADAEPQSVKIAFDAIGNTTQSEPEWVKTGHDAVTHFEVSLVADNTAIELSHVSGHAPTERLGVTVHEEDIGTNIGPNFSDGFEDGNTVYLARTSDDSLEIHETLVEGDPLETPVGVRLHSTGVPLLDVTLS